MSNRTKGRLGPDRPHLMSETQLRIVKVSDKSWWHDRKWYLTEVSAGMRDGCINWGSDLSEVDWSSEEWQSLVAAGRRFIDAFRNNDLFKSRSDTTVRDDGHLLLYFMRWMFEYKYRSFSQVDVVACRYFVQDVVADKLQSEDDSKKISAETLSYYFRIIELIYKYSVILEEFPEMQMVEHPFGGRSSLSLATEYIALNRAVVPAVPIKVFNPVMRAALTSLDEHNPHILALQYAYLDGLRDHGEANTKNIIWYTNRRIRELLPRHSEALRPALRPDSRFAFFSDSKVGLTPILRDLLDDHTGGLTLVVVGQVGLRPTELAGLRALPYDANGNPHCIVIRQSTTGLYEHFLVRGLLYKGQGDRKPREVEWLAGSRPTGSNWIPDPVRAILALEELYRPWRAMAKSDALIVSLSGGGGMPYGLPAKSRILTSTIVAYQNMFIQHHVELGDEHRGRRVTGPQWRKRYAENIIEIDEELVPEVRQQLKHVSDAITEEAYIGNDPYLRSMIDDQVAVTTGRAMYELLFGDQPVAGKIVDELKDHIPRIRTWCDQYSSDAEVLDALTQLFAQDGIRLWGSPYGNCIFRAEKSRCHHIENGEFDFKATRPLETHRCPDLCAGCANLMITARHAGFWRERYGRNLEICREATAAGLMAAATVARERAEVSRLILEKLEAQVNKVKEEAS